MVNDLTVTNVYRATLGELSRRYPVLEKLTSYEDMELEHRLWERDTFQSYDIQCVFIGKTGYGKSSALNSIIGKGVFATSSIASTTKQAQAADFSIDLKKNHYFSIADLPGIGESLGNDKKYMKLYSEILKKSDCVVYMLRADQRDYSIDLASIESLSINRSKMIIGLNFCDKIEPINRMLPFKPSGQQHRNLDLKKDIIAALFKMSKSNIIEISASDNWRIDSLIEKIYNVSILDTNVINDE